MKTTITLLILLAITTATHADKELNWSMRSSRNMTSPAVNIPSSINTNNLLWQIDIGNHQYTIPVIDNDRMYLGVNDALLRKNNKHKATLGGIVICINKNTGSEIWKHIVPKLNARDYAPDRHHFNDFNCGICSSPVINGKTICLIASNGTVICLDKTKGTLIWRYDLMKELNVFPHDVCGSTILLLNGNLYVCTSNGKDYNHDLTSNTKAPSLIVLDAETGKLVALADEKISENTLHGQWSSPSTGKVNGKDLIFFGGGDGKCYAFEALKKRTDKVQTLKKVWVTDCNPKEYRFNEDGTKAIYSGWRTKTKDGPSEIISSPVLYKNKIYVSIGQSPYHGPGAGIMHCLNAETGKPIWENRDVKRTTATAAIKDDLIYISDFSDQFLCIDASTGETYWIHDLNSAMWCASPVVVDNKVFIGTPRREMWIFKAGKEKQLIEKIKLKAIPIPIVAEDNILYIPTQTKLSAYRQMN